MELEIDLNKSVDENAGVYFDLAKKSKKKLEGAKAALEETKKKLEQLQKQEEKFFKQEELKKQKKEVKHEWYEKFHWFTSSEGFLCIGGKDATSNEIVVQKDVEKGDLVFHTEMPGSPFFVIKNGQNAGEKTLQETAIAVAVYSKAWKSGHTMADVFYVLPDQVSKEAQSGEYMSKGSFMVRGKKNIFHPQLEYAIGLFDGIIIGGPLSAVQIKTSNYVVVVPGVNEKKSELGKKVKAKLKGGDLDDIIKFLPAGGGQIKK